MLIAGDAPWKMWGGTQTVTTNVQLVGLGLLPQDNLNALAAVYYGRPESWGWLFQARLISGPDSTPGETLTVGITFNVALGLGRGMPRLYGQIGTQSRGLESLQFTMGPASPLFFRGAQLWSTKGQFARFMGEAVLPGIDTDRIVAETILCEASVTARAPAGNVAALGQPVVVEVTAQFAPLNHVRPDWYRVDGQLAEQFTGGEIGAR